MDQVDIHQKMGDNHIRTQRVPDMVFFHPLHRTNRRFGIHALPRLRGMRMRSLTTVLFCLLLCCGNGNTAENAEYTKIRVGIYQNSPKVFLDETGTPQGLFIDIMNAVAAKENLAIEYVFGAWQQNLRRLSDGTLDIVLDVSYSEERDRRYSLNSIPVIESWLQAFSRKGLRKISSLRDLAGLRIAVLEGSVQEDEFKEEIPKLYNIVFELKTYPDYQGTIDALAAGETDILIANRFFYFSPDRGKDIHPEPLVLRPAGVYFAFPKGKHGDLIARLDACLVAMKNNPDSAYYQALQRWLHELPSPALPRLAKWVLGWMLGGLALTVLFILLLRRQVRARTASLLSRNTELALANERLEKLVRKLVTAERRIQTSLEEKETLLKELYHRVKNNMQVVVSLLNLQAKQADNPELAEAFRDAVNRIHSMSLVHEKLYQSRDLSRIELGEYVQDLAMHLRQSICLDPDRLELVIAIPPTLLLIDSAVPLGIVLNELLANSFKHAFPRSQTGKISISLSMAEDGAMALDYHDNGPGISEERLDGAHEGTLGIQLIRNIIENQLHGTIVFRNEGGLACRIRFGPIDDNARV
jgi:two-component sensor histidine kinase/ABC-type amino acid transport substrate-binding protein